MSFRIDYQLQPDQPRRGEQMSLYAYVTLLEDTRCDAYAAHFKFTHPSGHVDEESRHCNGLDPQDGEWHMLIESFNPDEHGAYSVDLYITVNDDLKAHAHHGFQIE